MDQRGKIVDEARNNILSSAKELLQLRSKKFEVRFQLAILGSMIRKSDSADIDTLSDEGLVESLKFSKKVVKNTHEWAEDFKAKQVRK